MSSLLHAIERVERPGESQMASDGKKIPTTHHLNQEVAWKDRIQNDLV
jgi:hypothetical protein